MENGCPNPKTASKLPPKCQLQVIELQEPVGANPPANPTGQRCDYGLGQWTRRSNYTPAGRTMRLALAALLLLRVRVTMQH